MNRYSFLVLFTVLSICAAAQNFEWAKSIAGASAFNYSGDKLIAVDVEGNSYTTGTFSGTVDFDPGEGIYTLTGDNFLFISKLNSSGNFVWAKSIGQSGSACAGTAIALDHIGGIYITGTFNGTIDFDPGPGVYTLAASESGYHFNLKLTPEGNFDWASSLWGWSYSLAVDAYQNVYTTGSHFVFYGLNTLEDVFITKQDAEGNLKWIKYFGEQFGNERGESIAVDQSQNVYVASNTGSGSPGMVILKLNNSGEFLWAKNTYAYVSSICADALGNTISTGYFDGVVDFDPADGVFNLSGYNDAFISKLDPSGNFLWAKNIAEGNAEARPSSITLDAVDNVYITGYFTFEADFDPGAEISNLTSAGSSDIFIVKLNASGVFEWARNFGGADVDRGYSIAVDATRKIHTLGTFMGTVDFDPGPAAFPITAIGNDFFISQLCNVPSRITSISGSVLVAAESIQTYAVDASDGATGYEWTIPAGAIILEGQNTSVVKIKFTDVGGEVTVSATNACGQTNLSSLIVNIDPTTATDNLIYDVGISVFPNPTSETIVIAAGEAITCEYVMTDHTGKEVMRGKSDTINNSIDISQLAPGLYILTVGQSREKAFRIIKH